MGFKAWRSSSVWRAGGFISRSRRGLLVFLVLIVIAALVTVGGGFNSLRPGSLTSSEPPGQAEPDQQLRDSQAHYPSSGPVPELGRTLREPNVNPSEPDHSLIADAADVDWPESPDTSVAEREDNGEPEDGASIQGSVLDDAGEPLPNRVVSAQAAASGSNAELARAVTNRLGMFSFDSLPDDEYLLQVAGDEHFHAASLRVRSGTSAAELYLQRKGLIEVHGQVTDPAGQALAGVRVRSLGAGQQTLSDDVGNYHIEVERLRAGTAPVLEFRHDGYRDLRERIATPAGQASDRVTLNVTLSERGDTVSVSGWVSGTDGEPVAKAAVWLSSSSPPANHRTQTDAHGAYEFQRVERGEQYRLGVEPNDAQYQRYVSAPQRIGSQHVNHDVRLDKAGQAELSGVLVDPRGRPLPGFGIWLRQLDASAPAPQFIQADLRGQFAPVRVRSGSLKLESHSSPQLEASGIRLEAGESRFMQIPLDWGQAWLTGQVVNERDQPVARAEVVVQWRTTELEVASSSRRAVRADQAGFFSVANLGASHYHLTVSAPGFQTRRIQVSPTFGDEILIPMQAQQSIPGGGQ